MKPTLEQIESSAKRFAAVRLALITAVQVYDDSVQVARDEHWPGIRALANETAAERSDLANLIDHARDLFKDPRTIIVDGIKLGMAKGRGGLEYDDEDEVIARIEKYLPKLAATLIKTEKTLKKGALKELPSADLAKLGVSFESTGDAVFIKPVEGDVDKLVNAVLKEAEA